MPGLLRTIRAKLLFAFFGFLMIVSFLALVDFLFEIREKRIERILDKLQQVKLNLQTAERDQYVFFKDEIINPDFHKSGKSAVLERREKLIQSITQDLQDLRSFGEINTSKVVQETSNLTRNLQLYEDKFAQIVQLSRQRGFKDYGTEGDMRKYIHEIEESNTTFDMAKLLMIRRHEKDFILRKEKSYIEKLSKMVDLLAEEVQDQPRLSNLLRQYESAFKQLAKLEEQIGFNEDKGLKKELNAFQKSIISSIEKIDAEITGQVNYLRAQNNVIQLGVVIGGGGLIIFLGFFLTRILSRPISKLSGSIHRIVESNFDDAVHFPQIKSRDELGMLSQDVSFMIDRVKASLNEIKDKSEKVERKHRILMEGVTYAKRIQQAILPTYTIEQYFKKFFVIYRPQFDVSGDFYWFTRHDDKYLLAVVDCTGKGVSGAFMSMIGNTLLNEVIDEKNIEDPSLILETLNTEFRISLHQEQNLSSDSMDVCLCKIEKSPDKENYWNITYAGANRPLIYSQGWNICELKPTPRSIGGRDINKQLSFENQSIELKKGDFLYLSTDGFVNQSNAEKEKYGMTRFKEFLQHIIHLPTEEQAQRLEQELDRYMKDTTQKDDITLFALKL